MGRSLELVLIVATLSLFAELSFADCDAMLTARNAVLDTGLPLRSDEEVSYELRLAANQEVALFVKETGIDVHVELRNGGRKVAQADSPVSRSGIQRIVFKTQPPYDYSATLKGERRGIGAGDVGLRMVVWPVARQSDRCLAVQRRLSDADGAYAAGQTITQGKAGRTNASAANDYQVSAAAYEQALSMLEGEASPALRADIQHALSRVFDFDALMDWVKSEAWARRAAASYAGAGDDYGNARATATQAASLLEVTRSLRPLSGQGATSSDGLAAARALLAPIIEFHQKRGEKFEQALALNNTGLAYFYEGVYDRAIDMFRRSSTLFDALAESGWRSTALQNMTVSEYRLGRLPQAVAGYERLLQLLEPETEPRVRATILNNSALANRDIGKFDVALRQYLQALELEEDAQNHREASRSLHGIGFVYEGVGDEQLALHYYGRALEVRTEKQDPRGRVATLRAIANIHREQGRASQALELHNEALNLAGEAAPPGTKGRIHIQIAQDLVALGRLVDARASLDSAIAAHPSDSILRARALLVRAQIVTAPRESRRLEADLEMAVRTFDAQQSPAEAYQALMAVARLLRRRGATDAALMALDRALLRAEDVRDQSANPELRAALFHPLRPAFDLKIALLAERHFQMQRSNPQSTKYALLALQVAEQARGRAFADFQRIDLAAPAIDSKLLQRRSAIYQELSAHYAQLEAGRERVADSDPWLQSILRDIATLRSELDQLNATLAAASLRNPDPSSLLTQQRLAAIPKDTTVIEYWVGAHNTFAWVIDRGQVSLKRVAGSREVTQAAREFHDRLAQLGAFSRTQRLTAAEQLHTLLLGSLIDAIPAKQSLIFVPDGVLYYTPFAALRRRGAKQGYLVEHHDVSLAPSVSMLVSSAEAPKPTFSKEMLIVSDPVYDAADARIPQSGAAAPSTRGFTSLLSNVFRGGSLAAPPRLSGTALEAEDIERRIKSGVVDRLDGPRATKRNLLDVGIDQYRYIHIGAHAVANTKVPALSAILLSTHDGDGKRIDGEVFSADLLGLKFNADVVVINSCDSAIGSNRLGEGLLSLQYTVLARGAAAVLSALWAVPDDRAPEVMSTYYRLLLTEKRSAPVALNEAMRTMIRASADPSVWAVYAYMRRQ